MWKKGKLLALPSGPGAGSEGEADVGDVSQLLSVARRAQERGALSAP